jgi:hypothetical protein
MIPPLLQREMRPEYHMQIGRLFGIIANFTSQAVASESRLESRSPSPLVA